MNLVDHVIALSVRNRWFVLFLTVLAAVAAGFVTQRMTFDAFPDITNVQVQILTTAPGLGSEEVEMLVTLPVERSLGGVDGIRELRSISRPGVSSVTAVFEDGTDRWLARQKVKEQVDIARGEIPTSAGTPELAPPSTGLGEVFQFTVASDSMEPHELYRVFQRDIAPRLRSIEGVVEVNAWGGAIPQVDVRLDPYALVAHGITLDEVAGAIDATVAITSAGDVSGGSERASVRASSNPADPETLREIVVRSDERGTVQLGQLASIGIDGGLTVGLGTADAQGEVIFALVQLLAGADALSVVDEVRETLPDIIATLPPGVRIEAIYDREKLVGSTLETVTHSLLEGAILVVVVLLLLLGDLRAGVLVASVIPLAMLGAFVGLASLGFSGNLMSLGAVDFGLIVDGTIVVVESILAMHIVRASRQESVVETTQAVTRPVLFAVGILVLVYLPVLGMAGTEGKLFRPMAVTVLFALITALFLSFTYVPAAASLLLRPSGEHHTRVVRLLRRVYDPLILRLQRVPRLVASLAALWIVVCLALVATLGVEFVPRLEEGDLVVQTSRLPSISPQQAAQEVARVERVLASFPEVERVASRTGSPALATDPMGLEEADILVKLRPRDAWEATSTEALSSAMSARLEAEAPGPEYTFTQPIEMRFNELLEGITADVGIQIHGQDLDELLALGQRFAAELEQVPGAADVTAPTLDGMPGVEIQLDTVALASVGMGAAQVHALAAAYQRGVPVGTWRRGQYQEPIVLKLDTPRDTALADLPVVLPGGGHVTLGDLASIVGTTTPAVIRRAGGSRRVTVQANVRGRDLGSFVEEAQRRIEALERPRGTWITWAGKYEQLQAAAMRTAISVPLVLFLILVVLYYAFGAWRPAWLIFLNVPAAASGGVLALVFRGLPLSMSAIVGFIALFGVAVMNGIVLLSRTRALHLTSSSHAAALHSASERFRPVVTTALVAGIGFVPMALATGMGAEVQRPLATVVIGGLCTSTPLTLLVLPTLYGWWFADEDVEDATPA